LSNGSSLEQINHMEVSFKRPEAIYVTWTRLELPHLVPKNLTTLCNVGSKYAGPATNVSEPTLGNNTE